MSIRLSIRRPERGEPRESGVGPLPPRTLNLAIKPAPREWMTAKPYEGLITNCRCTRTKTLTSSITTVCTLKSKAGAQTKRCSMQVALLMARHDVFLPWTYWPRAKRARQVWGSSSASDSTPSEARKRGFGGGSPRKYHNWPTGPRIDIRHLVRYSGESELSSVREPITAKFMCPIARSPHYPEADSVNAESLLTEHQVRRLNPSRR